MLSVTIRGRERGRGKKGGGRNGGWRGEEGIGRVKGRERRGEGGNDIAHSYMLQIYEPAVLVTSLLLYL